MQSTETIHRQNRQQENKSSRMRFRTLVGSQVFGADEIKQVAQATLLKTLSRVPLCIWHVLTCLHSHAPKIKACVADIQSFSLIPCNCLRLLQVHPFGLTGASTPQPPASFAGSIGFWC